MSLNLVISPRAHADLNDAWRWYEDRQQGVGDRFMLRVDEVLARICRDPEMFPILQRGARWAAVPRFPYGILYRVEDSDLVVLGVIHGRRGPREWKSRT